MNSTRAGAVILTIASGCAQRPSTTGGRSLDGATRSTPVGEAGPPPSSSSPSQSPSPPCTAFEPLGPFATPEEACPTLLLACKDPDARPCQCVRRRDLERPAGPFEVVSVLEVRGTWVMPRAFTLAVRRAGQWYVASRYPSSDSIEGGMESLGVEVIEAPRVDVGPLAAAGDVQTVVLSLERGDCRWQKWERSPSGGVRPARLPTCARASGVALQREDSLACAIGPSLRPSCTDDHLGFEPPAGARSCRAGVFR
jgi:hypothetical protein